MRNQCSTSSGYSAFMLPGAVVEFAAFLKKKKTLQNWTSTKYKLQF